MKNKPILIIAGLILILSSCATPENPPTKKDQFPKVYTFDLDDDFKKEIITVDKSSGLEAKYTINIERRESKKEKSQVTSFIVPGAFQRIEFSELNENESPQMIIYYESKRGYQNMLIYDLNNDKLTKLFASSDCCDLAVDFKPALSRLRLNRPKCRANQNCSCEHMPEWESWVWSGSAFIKE